MARWRSARRLVVRVAGVLLGRHVRRGVGDQAFLGEPLQHQLLDVELRRRDAVAQAARRLGERLVLDAVEPLRRPRGACATAARPSAPRSAGRDRPTTPRRRRARGPSRWCRRRPGRGTGWRSRASTPWRRGQRPPAGVSRVRATARPAYVVLGPGQVVEVVALDRVDEAPGLAVRRDQVEPAAGGQLPAAAVEPASRARNRVRPLKVVQQPAVEAVVLERVLDSGDVDRTSVSEYSRPPLALTLGPSSQSFRLGRAG